MLLLPRAVPVPSIVALAGSAPLLSTAENVDDIIARFLPVSPLPPPAEVCFSPVRSARGERMVLGAERHWPMVGGKSEE